MIRRRIRREMRARALHAALLQKCKQRAPQLQRDYFLVGKVRI
jgi:hypothetical protein